MTLEPKQKPDDWDWVSERGRCSGVAIFQALLGLAKQNVKERNAQNKETEERFRISQTQQHTFAVDDARVRLGLRFVCIELSADEIHVRGSGTMTEAIYTLALTDAGDCRLWCGNVPYQPWQVMRRALEDLFFADRTHSS